MDLKKTGRLISKKRKGLDLTQGQLSELLGVTPQAVHLWETGQRYPDVSSQIMIHKVLNLNPVELISGLEMFDEDLKKAVSSYMNRIDEKVFVAGHMKDADDSEAYLDLSEFDVVATDKDGNLTDKCIPFTDYYNVEPPKDNPIEKTKSPYDPTKIYLNHRDSILTISIEVLKKFGSPLYFNISYNRKKGCLLIKFEDKMSDNSFDIPEKVYNGKWKGIRVHGGEFGHVLCVEMGVRYYFDLLECTPKFDTENNIIVMPLDEVKRSTADIERSDFLLPQWQYDELYDEEMSDDEE